MTHIDNPYPSTPEHKLRGNLHAHSTRSDGSRTPQGVIDDYASRGYHFLMLSDHNCLSDYKGLDPRGMILIPGNEVTAKIHTLHLNAKSLVKSSDDPQDVIDAVLKDGGYTIMNHPNWQESFNHIPQPVLEKSDGYLGIEVLNGVVKRLYGNELATDRWDMLLSAGRKVLGFGNDDAHHDDDSGLAWNIVWTDDRSPAGVVKALTTGSFYVSSGVEITAIRVVGEYLHVETANARRMIVTSMHGKRVADVIGREVHYRIKDSDAGYLRVSAYGDPDEYAFTQPFYLTSGSKEQPALPVEDVAKIDSPIAMTGELTDLRWATIEPLRRFAETNTGKRAVFSPVVKLASDGKTLFIGIRCVEPLPDEMKLGVTANGDNRLWSDDGFEIFIDPTNDRKSYYQLMLNASGYSHIQSYDSPAYQGTIVTKASRYEDGYRLEIAIPVSGFGEAGRSKRWAINIARNKLTSPREQSQWVATAGNYHRPQLFGEIRFKE